MLKMHTGNYNAFLKSLALVVSDAVEEGVQVTKNNVHVDTGRLRASVRKSKPTITDKSITVDLIVGGVALSGVVKEQGIRKPVDYALEEETRHPIVRQVAVPAIANAIERRKP